MNYPWPYVNLKYKKLRNSEKFSKQAVTENLNTWDWTILSFSHRCINVIINLKIISTFYTKFTLMNTKRSQCFTIQNTLSLAMPKHTTSTHADLILFQKTDENVKCTIGLKLAIALQLKSPARKHPSTDTIKFYNK